MRETVEATYSRERFTARLVGILGIVALSLAAIGFYGLLAYGVAERRGEIGLRMALGANPRNIVGMFLRETGTILAAGIAGGVAVALLTTRFLTGLLWGLEPNDPVTIAAAIIILVAVSLVAASWPAWRASRIAPMRTMRHN